MDMLIDAASALAQKDIHFSKETWEPYNALWLDVMKAVLVNRREAVLFTPLSPADLSSRPIWCSNIRWLLLDCADQVIHQRLSSRTWPEDRIRDALADAAELRQSGIRKVIRTDELDHNQVAEAISGWLVSSA